MSSPMMTRMLGFCCCWAESGVTNAAAVATEVTRPRHARLKMLMIKLLVLFLLVAPDRRACRRGGPHGPPAPPARSELLARVPLTLLELFHDLIQVVARRILKGGKLPVGFQLLQPQHLPDGQQVPVVYVSAGRPGERAAEPETRLFLVAPRHLEWIALEVYHAGCELGLDSRGEEARRGFGRDREIHLPILVAHRRRVAAGIVEEGVARRLLRFAGQIVDLVHAIELGLDDAWIGAGHDPLVQRIALVSARDLDERGEPVERREDVVLDGPGLDDARPA